MKAMGWGKAGMTKEPRSALHEVNVNVAKADSGDLFCTYYTYRKHPY